MRQRWWGVCVILSRCSIWNFDSWSSVYVIRKMKCRNWHQDPIVLFLIYAARSCVGISFLPEIPSLVTIPCIKLIWLYITVSCVTFIKLYIFRYFVWQNCPLIPVTGLFSSLILLNSQFCCKISHADLVWCLLPTLLCSAVVLKLCRFGSAIFIVLGKKRNKIYKNRNNDRCAEYTVQ
jgi:hypothetical protein